LENKTNPPVPSLRGEEHKKSSFLSFVKMGKRRFKTVLPIAVDWKNKKLDSCFSRNDKKM